MEKGINLKICEFKLNIEKCVNDSLLPPGIVQSILEGYLRQVVDLNTQAIINEKEEFEKERDKDGQSVQ